jgi:hypothetical protein
MMEQESIDVLKARYAKGEITKNEYLEIKGELVKEEANKEERKNKENRGGGAGKIMGFVIFVALILVLLYFLSTGALNSLISGAVANSGGITNPTVLVSGYVKTSFSTTPSSITFGASTVPITNGRYSVSLQNDQQYGVVVSYSSLTGTQNCNAGSLDLQTAENSYNYNVSC